MYACMLCMYACMFGNIHTYRFQAFLVPGSKVVPGRLQEAVLEASLVQAVPKYKRWYKILSLSREFEVATICVYFHLSFSRVRILLLCLIRAFTGSLYIFDKLRSALMWSCFKAAPMPQIGFKRPSVERIWSHRNFRLLPGADCQTALRVPQSVVSL